MSFEWQAEEQRVRINLSERAGLIMEEDMYQYGIDSRSLFINQVFHNYYMSAPASISLYLQNRRMQLENQFSDIFPDQSVFELVVERLIEKEKKNLMKRIERELRSKYKGNYYRVNNENLAYLRSEECQEDSYYNQRPAQYIKCVLEEYTELPFLEREKIFFAEMYSIAEDAIKTNSMLKIRTKGDLLFHVYPYSLEADPLSTRLYLTGFSKSINAPRNEKVPASFRIPGLKSLTKLQKTSRLTSEETAEIKQAIRDKTAQFLLGDEDTRENTIRVRLTQNGIRKYSSQLFLRPHRNKELSTENEYVFNCTQRQAEYYFFKFGEDAEILEPLSLRNKFISMYKNALNHYSL